MPCLLAHSRLRRGALVFGTLLASASCTTLAERVGPSPYHVPALVLAYPGRGIALPADRPVVLLRFAPREADDPIDVTSFRATVDGVDATGRSALRATKRGARSATPSRVQPVC